MTFARALLFCALALTPVAAAAKKTAPAPRATAAECAAMLASGRAQLESKKPDDAVATFAKGYAACGPGSGFLGAEGVARVSQGKLVDAAELYIMEISEANPRGETFANLERIRDQLPEPLRRRIAKLGVDARTPVHVLGTHGEYTWARAFTCLGTTSQLRGLLRAAGGPVDVLEFNCQDGLRHKVYFNPGTDAANTLH